MRNNFDSFFIIPIIITITAIVLFFFSSQVLG